MQMYVEKIIRRKQSVISSTYDPNRKPKTVLYIRSMRLNRISIRDRLCDTSPSARG